MFRRIFESKFIRSLNQHAGGYDNLDWDNAIILIPYVGDAYQHPEKFKGDEFLLLVEPLDDGSDRVYTVANIRDTSVWEHPTDAPHKACHIRASITKYRALRQHIGDDSYNEAEGDDMWDML